MDGVILPGNAVILNTKSDVHIRYPSQNRYHYFVGMEYRTKECPRRRICNCVHEQSTLMKMHLHDGSELIVVTHWAGWSQSTVTDWHNCADQLWQLPQLQRLWWLQSTSIMENQSSPTIWIIFDCNYIKDKVAINKSGTNDPSTLSKENPIRGVGTHCVTGQKC